MRHTSGAFVEHIAEEEQYAFFSSNISLGSRPQKT